MLTDIFAIRYADRPIWNTVGEAETALCTQGYRILAEQIIPPQTPDKKDLPDNNKRWESLERRISMELGLAELSPHAYATTTTSGLWPMYWVCRTWMLADPSGLNPDRYMKERVSLIEVGFRDQMWSVAQANQKRAADKEKFDKKTQCSQSDVWLEQIAASQNLAMNRAYEANVNELNERLRRARVPLHYHNGFVQLTTDGRTEQQIVQPFWRLAADKKWENVSIDMAEAVDRRDTGGRDPAFYAAKALESVIKIISDEKGWTHGKEKGAANYVDNLVKERSGARFIDIWEKDLLVAYFAKVRNQFGHGPGGEAMPNLTGPQTDWAIEDAMSWCKSLIVRP